MWLLYLSWWWAALALGAATNQSAPTDHLESTRAAPATELLSQLSSCALKCIVQEAPKVGCGILDVECQCASEPLYGLLVECVIDSCTIAEAIGLAKVDAKQCHRPTETRQHMILGISIASGVIILSAYIFRMISRLAISRYCWWDDLFHTVSIGFVIPMTIFANLIYVCQILWAFNILALKISILCLYLRLFPGRRFRHVCTAALALLVVSSLLLIALDIFQCIPVSAAWTLQHGEAQCLDLTVVALANAAVNIFTEAAIWLSRYRSSSSSNCRRGRRPSRPPDPLLQTLKSLVDATYTNAPVFMWTCVEAMVAHLCVAAPAIKLLFTKVKTRVNTSLEGGSSGYQSFGKGEQSSKLSTMCRKGSLAKGGQPQKSWDQNNHTVDGSVGEDYEMDGRWRPQDGIRLEARIERTNEMKRSQTKYDTTWLA
ncbi:integral membrane protein [Apiospora phragmitis]|uniref:Integral membrane protein n=1 Tax=Apiospora phragmitis TaxID=2905665 RepID=A0ABR1VSI3_9PEZI